VTFAARLAQTVAVKQEAGGAGIGAELAQRRGTLAHRQSFEVWMAELLAPRLTLLPVKLQQAGLECIAHRAHQFGLVIHEQSDRTDEGWQRSDDGLGLPQLHPTLAARREDQPDRIDAKLHRDAAYERFFGAGVTLSDLAAIRSRPEEERGTLAEPSRFGTLARRVFQPLLTVEELR
jgi:hypothetical protein